MKKRYNKFNRRKLAELDLFDWTPIDYQNERKNKEAFI